MNIKTIARIIKCDVKKRNLTKEMEKILDTEEGQKYSNWIAAGFIEGFVPALAICIPVLLIANAVAGKGRA